jgi:hypothetical protein
VSNAPASRSCPTSDVDDWLIVRAKTIRWTKLLILASLLLVSGLAIFAALAGLRPSQPNERSLLFSLTGEEALLPQIKGLSDLAASAMRPRLHTEDSTPVAHAGVNPFGVNVFLEQEVEPAKRELAVRMAREAGFRWLRQEFPWEDIEIHGKGDFEDRRHEPYRSAWEKYDHIVDLAEQYDMELIVRLSNPPAWTRAAGDEAGTYAPPDNLEDYGDYVQAVVERYKGRVRYYQIWNEPNIYPEWGEATISPEDYTELLKVGAERARAVNPEVVIISGALASTIDLDGIHVPSHNFNDLDLLAAHVRRRRGPLLRRAGHAGLRPVVGADRPAHEPAGDQLQPAALRARRDGAQRRRRQGHLDQRDELERGAGRDRRQALRPGQPGAAGRVPAPGLRAPAARVALAGRGQHLVSQARHRRLGAEQPARGLLPPAGPRLHAAAGLRQHEGYTASLQPTLYAGHHQEDHWALHYSGAWETVKDSEAELGQFVQTSDPQAVLTFTFQGSDLILVAPKGPGMGRWLVEVDGRERARVNLAASSATPARPATVVRSLSSDKPHQVVLRPEVGADGQMVGPVAVDGLIVQSRNMAWVNGLYCLTTLIFLAVAGFIFYLWQASKRSIPQQAGWEE